MKSYTDLEQSKKLAKILPLESADMHYVLTDSDQETYSPGLEKYYGVLPSIPCWSLAALLGVIPKPDLIQNSEEIWLVHSWVNAYPWSVGGYSNPIDACVAMIEKLHKINLI